MYNPESETWTGIQQRVEVPSYEFLRPLSQTTLNWLCHFALGESKNATSVGSPERSPISDLSWSLWAGKAYSWFIRDGKAGLWSCSNGLSPDSPTWQVSSLEASGERGPREHKNTCCPCRGPPGRPEGKGHFFDCRGWETAADWRGFPLRLQLALTPE